MRTDRLKCTLVLIGLLFIESRNGSACARTQRPATPQNLSAAIAELRSGKHEMEPDASKDDAGLHLAHVIRRVKPDQVDDKSIADIESLLESSDDYIRFWSATSLGELGPRAKMAVPRLLKLLPVVDCLNGPITSETAIRLALKRTGVTPPPLPACQDRISGD
jgi:hypothetical protein